MKIMLREVKPEDEELIRGWRNLPEVARYMFTDHCIAPDEHARWFKEVLNDPQRRLWIISAEGEDVGAVNLVWHGQC